MPNCRKAAEHLAASFLFSDELAHWEGEDVPRPLEIARTLADLRGELDAFFREMGRQPFEGFAHDMANLIGQVESSHPQPYFIRRYAEDLQKQILSQGWLDLIDCQCRKGT